MKKAFLLCLSLLVLGVITSASFAIATDISRVGVGAGPLGMGKVYLGLAEDANSIFLNPSGLSTINGWEVTSMYTSLLNQITYFVAGGAYTTQVGTIGLGYVGASLSGAAGARIDPTTGWLLPSGSTLGFSSSALLVSYGVGLKDLNFLSDIPIVKDFAWTDDISLGGTIKLFGSGITGTAEGSASGMDLDLGLTYKVNPWLNFAMVSQDTLPMSLGGKIKWSSGTEEGIPYLMRMGVGAKIFGTENAYTTMGTSQLNGGLDVDLNNLNSNKPMTAHIGAEFLPVEYLAIRAGIDQAPAANSDGSYSVTNNFTAGLGVKYHGVGFDYAYHEYDLASNNTHYLSISYSFNPPAGKKVEKMVKGRSLRIDNPIDSSVIYSEGLEIKGTVLVPDVKQVFVNGKAAILKENLEFAASVPLKMGKNTILVSSLTEDGKVIETVKIRLLRMATFKDVASNNPARPAIEQAATLGIVSGYPDNTFRPEGTVTRAELTAMLSRAAGASLPKVERSVFKDVAKTNWAAGYIKSATEKELVLGYPDKTFRPLRSITRAEGVAVLARFGGIEKPFGSVTSIAYPDIPPSHWAASIIMAAKDAGLLTDTLWDLFKPRKGMTRAETTLILNRTAPVAKQISDLMNWDKDY